MRSSFPPGPQRVLVLDDNRDMAENVAELFAAVGCASEIATSGAQALTAAREHPVDLAVVDVQLPGESGIRVAAELKRLRAETEVILMTANATLDSAIAAIQQDAFAYVQKPFDAAELIAIGERALDRVRMRRERARLERELGRSEALYRGVVDTVDRYIVVLGEVGEIHMWNRSAAESSGWPAAEVVGRPLSSLLAGGKSALRFQEALARVSHGEAVVDLELPLRTPRGAQRIVRWQLSHFTPSEAPSPAVLAVGADMTDRLELERRAAEAEAMASIATLTTGLAHEIRNPLNAASLQLELLDRACQRVHEEEVRDRLADRTRIVREELSRLTRLLDDFLNLARPRATALEAVELRPLAAEIVALHEPAARDAGVELRVAIPEGVPPVRGDEAMLKQVMVNLIVNAMDALGTTTREPKTITIAAAPSGDARVEISVADNGPGVAEEVAERLFVPFVTSKAAGSGLGLTIVKRIVDRHGGSIHVASKPNEGTQVHIHLARAR